MVMTSDGHPAGASAPAGPEARNPSLLGLLNVVLRHRVMIALLALTLGAVWVTLALIAPRTHTSVASFVPQDRAAGGNLPGVVAQLGLNIGGGGGGTASPDFYVDLVTARPVMLAVAAETLSYRNEAGQPVQGTLADFYEIREATPALSREYAIRRLKQDIGAGASIKTGVITVRVRATQPEVAFQIADKVLAEVHEYNLNSRQRQAAADRRFAEQRLQDLEVSLRRAEDRLQSFLELNRNPQAPRLAMQLDRLRRDVSMQQSLYTALAQNYGQSKIEEVRDTPVIATVETPEVPVLPDKRGLPVKLLVGLLLGTLLGTVLAFIKDYFSRTRSAAPDDFQEFARLRRAAVDDMLHPWRPLGRAVRSRRS